MRAEEMRALSDDDVTSRIAELERERFNLRFKAGTQPLEDPLRLRAVRKDLARLKTLVRERELGVVREAPAASAPAKKSAAKKAATKSATKKTATKRASAKQATTTSATTKQAPARGRRSGR